MPDPDRTRRLGSNRFERLIRCEVAWSGGVRPSLRIARNLFTALSDWADMTANRSRALERIRFLLSDWDNAAGCLTDVETR